MKEKLIKYGWIGEVVGVVALGAAAIVAECRRHKTKKQLINTEIRLACTEIDGVLKDARIRCLENELEKAKSESKEKES